MKHSEWRSEMEAEKGSHATQGLGAMIMSTNLNLCNMGNHWEILRREMM